MLELPSGAEIIRVLTLQDYNTRIVIIGTTLLGLAAGLVGTFLLMRKRALLSDTLSHATLPGIALTFILITYWGGDGKNLIALITGAAVFSVLGTVSVILIQKYSRLKDDAALGIVLSVYFGFGIALLGLASRMESGTAAGLSSFIYGKTASMLFFDAVLIGATALGSAIVCILLFKEFTLICFDYHYAATQGWPVVRLDFLMMALAVVVTVVGLQAVGLILVVALLIIPPSAARFWTHSLKNMLILSGFFGALSGLLGSTFSALMANLPAGAVIVIMAAVVFVFSLAFGSASGLIHQMVERRRLTNKVARENLLRKLYELYELRGPTKTTSDVAVGIPFADLLAARTWSSARLRRTLNAARSDGMIQGNQNQRLSLTDKGLNEAYKIVRKHRLWEAYLITHADIAPSQVDWGADAIEHVLDREMIQKLENMLPELKDVKMPPSPHELMGAQPAG
ncbi:MAG: metal ABC transporter permease [Deltaproteobacteria bacterium]|nr:metal ABC transporter permease [Deltaproteobacteria bacterium]